MASPQAAEELKHEITALERRLQDARARLGLRNQTAEDTPSLSSCKPSPAAPLSATSSAHFLLLLADSALPVGSFAFSSGLESYVAHNPRASAFATFLPLSLSAVASATLPFVLAAHRTPSALAALDDQLDAAVACAVGRRASVAQGRALLSVWERSFRPALPPGCGGGGGGGAGAQVLADFAALLRRESKAGGVPLVSAHLGPLFGAICAVVGLSCRQTAYVFMLSHVKALVSAAVRASLFGPYQAQKLLAGDNVQGTIDVLIEREWGTPVEEAGQSVPVMDLWVGRHEVLYSRIFNS